MPAPYGSPSNSTAATAPFRCSLRFRMWNIRPPLDVESLVACCSALRLGRRSRSEAVAAHDLGHLRSVRRPAGRCLDYLGSLAEILWTERRRRDHAKRLHVPAAVVVEPVDGAARNAERLP